MREKPSTLAKVREGAIWGWRHRCWEVEQTARKETEKRERLFQMDQIEQNDWVTATGTHRPKWRCGAGTMVRPRSAYLIALR